MTVSDWVKRFSTLIKPDGVVLDLACGSGRNGRFFLNQHTDTTVHFVDIDTTKLSDLNDISKATIIQKDLECLDHLPFETWSYDAIIVTNYLYRPHLNDLIKCLKSGGILIYETFAIGNEKFGRPKNPDFLLKPNELLERFMPYGHVIAFEHGQMKDRVIQRICFQRTDQTDPAPLSIDY